MSTTITVEAKESFGVPLQPLTKELILYFANAPLSSASSLTRAFRPFFFGYLSEAYGQRQIRTGIHKVYCTYGGGAFRINELHYKDRHRDIRALMNIHVHANINTNTSALSALMGKEEAVRRDK